MLDDYPAPPQQDVHIGFQIDDKGAKIRREFANWRMQGPDGTDILLIGVDKITTSRLAPYEGWEPFFARARTNWSEWKRVVGWKPISRIGVRYINRIDVPIPENGLIELTDWLTVSPRTPQIGTVPPLQNFAVNTLAPLGSDDCKLILNVGTMPSPLVKMASFLVDLDISVDSDLPQNDEGLWALVAKIRGHKNGVFEACITDKTRALFS
jgi:uncharacterized protein (TIGR04255 family)